MGVCSMKTMKWIVRYLCLVLCMFAGPLSAGEQTEGRFLVQGETIIDTRAGLMWAAKDNGQDISWHDAKVYCEKYRGGGYANWRMPTQDELVGIYDLDNTSEYSVAGNIVVTACCIWASDQKDSRVASFDFDYGNRDWGQPLSTVDARVLPVRNVK